VAYREGSGVFIHQFMHGGIKRHGSPEDSDVSDSEVAGSPKSHSDITVDENVSHSSIFQFEQSQLMHCRIFQSHSLNTPTLTNLPCTLRTFPASPILHRSTHPSVRCPANLFHLHHRFQRPRRPAHSWMSSRRELMQSKLIWRNQIAR
jgi:hypothetical protein